MKDHIEIKPGEDISRAIQSKKKETLEGLGAILTGQFQKSFREQRSPKGVTWPKRMTPNVVGIVKDLNAGGNPKSRRFSSGQALVDTGVLRRSLTWNVRGSEVEVGTNLGYAAAHNQGNRPQTITLNNKRGLALFLRRRRDIKSLGWLFSKPTFVVTPRKRTFVEIGSKEKQLILQNIKRSMLELPNG